ncbi:hypothetical protein ACVJBD_003366 [Rhizobium mongolense]
MGDPTEAGEVVTRSKFPSNYQVPPHTGPFRLLSASPDSYNVEWNAIFPIHAFAVTF